MRRLGQLWDVSNARPSASHILLWNATTGRWEPSFVGSASLSAGAATDTVIGSRTISDTSAPTGDTGVLTTLLGWLANMVKSITGKANWRTVPAISLETLNLHASRHASAGADPVTPAAIGAATSGHNHDATYVNVTGDVMTGDLTVYRSGAPTTGVVYLNQAQTRYLFFNGSDYHLPSSGLVINGGTAWHSANDGAGSGLDADTVDGSHAADLATSGHVHDTRYGRVVCGTYVGNGSASRTISPGIGNLAQVTIWEAASGSNWLLVGSTTGGSDGPASVVNASTGSSNVVGHLKISGGNSFILRIGGDSGLGANINGTTYYYVAISAPNV